LAAVIVAGAALFVDHLHDDAILTTQRNLKGLSAILADQADRSLQAIELVQDGVIEEIRNAKISSEAEYVTAMSSISVHRTLKDRITALPQVNAVTLVDSAGQLINFSRYWPIPPVNIADRDYFKALVADPTRQRFVSEPVPNRGDGTWTIYIARKLSGRDGAFLGLVLGAVQLDYFQELYSRIAPEPDYVFSMFRTDSVLLVRHPHREGSIGRGFATAGAPRLQASGVQGGVIRNVSPIDGQDRLIAAAALAHYPVILSVSRTTAASLAPWRHQAIVLGGAALLLLAGLGSIVVLGLRQIKGQARLAKAEAARSAAEERERGERTIREQHASFGVALNSMMQGLCMFDAAGTLIVMNGRFVDLYGVPPGLRGAGTSATALRGHLTALLHPDSRSDDAFAVGSSRKQVSTSSYDLADGRSVSVVHAPVPAGGWVCTHEDVTEQRKSEARIAHMARHDALTDLPNRLMLREHMERVLAHVRRGGSAAVLCLDLDGFKGVNDALGHSAGDELLRLVAARLRERVRDVDLVARLGGDEFAVVLDTAEHAADTAALAESLVAALREPFEMQGQQIVIGTSIGIALAQDPDVTAERLLRDADIALYRAKAGGRGTWCFFETGMDAEIQHRRSLEADLHRAVAEEQFEIHYQPVVAAGSRALTGFEALLRWRHPKRGLVSPCEFIPILEEIGLIRPVGAWVLMRACADAAMWPDQIKLAVNLSPVQFAHGSLYDEVAAALTHSNLPAGRLELEITESVLLQESASNLAVLRAFHDLGIRIAMDDFGTGYASLNYLRQFPFDKIKIDQTFVRDLLDGSGNIEIVRATVSLGKALGMSVHAEGVETDGQMRLLEEEGCDELQGYLLSKPQPISHFAGLLAQPSPSLAPAGDAITPELSAAA
jgi:diguanylate cyclase (GGDEF)-like protein